MKWLQSFMKLCALIFWVIVLTEVNVNVVHRDQYQYIPSTSHDITTYMNNKNKYFTLYIYYICIIWMFLHVFFSLKKLNDLFTNAATFITLGSKQKILHTQFKTKCIHLYHDYLLHSLYTILNMKYQ